MGYTIKLKCSCCNIEKNFDLGNGKKDFDINMVAKRFEDKKNVDIILNRGKKWLFNWKLAQCKSCKEVFRVPTAIELDEQGKELLEAICKCGCKEVDIFSDEDLQQINCSECEGKYVVENIGLWD